MLNKIAKIIITMVGGLLGYSLVSILESFEIIKLISGGWMGIVITFGSVGVFAIIFYLFSPKIIKTLRKRIGFIEDEIQKIPISQIVLGTLGLIVGLIIAFFISQPFARLQGAVLSSVIQIAIFLVFGYLGVSVSTKKRVDLEGFMQKFTSRFEFPQKTEEVEFNGIPKILDTSVIIDGRIADICKTGFMEGPLIIPNFVLKELQNIADSSDDLKRQRGRRGLDILSQIQEGLDIEVVVHQKNFDDIVEVDSKLLELAKLLDGKVVTNDYNLNKVAKVQDIEVLNINDLANSVKPVVIPGEEMAVEVIRGGKEAGQGLAYLDDGTMIVVESGKKHIGKTIDVTVTSVLQTSAGKMIFGKPKTL